MAYAIPGSALYTQQEDGAVVGVSGTAKPSFVLCWLRWGHAASSVAKVRSTLSFLCFLLEFPVNKVGSYLFFENSEILLNLLQSCVCEC